MNDQKREERQCSPAAPTVDQSETTVTMVFLGATFLCTKQLQLISSHRTSDKTDEKLRVAEEVGPRKPEQLV